MPPQLEKNHVGPTAWQDEALARDGVSREVPCSALKGETVPDSLTATPKSPPTRRVPRGEHRGLAILGDPGADEMGVRSRSCNPRERNWDRPPPKAIGISTRTARVYPVPGALPGRFQPQCPPPKAQLGSPPPPPPEADPGPTPPAFASPLHVPGTFPASSVHARVGAGCRSMGDVSGT